jgi:RNA polymerase sigma-70 factor (ECF subfamily)
MDSPQSGATSPSAVDLARWFNQEVQPHDADLKAYLRGAFPGVRDVDDVVQESYLRVCRARAVGPISTARGFLFRVARNLALDGLRSARRRPVAQVGDMAALDAVSDQPSAADTAVESEKFVALDAALASLSSRQRQVVMLCKLQSRSHCEVALRLGLSEKTVAEHLYRGMQRLGEELQRRGFHRFQP